jgi:DNA-binding response OmpR family regulator
VAPDNALRRSLRFALEAEGFDVITAARLAAEGNDHSSAKVSCVVLDDRSLAASDAGRIERLGMPVIFLSDGLGGPKLAAKQTLVKPLLGRELIDAVAETIAATQPT